MRSLILALIVVVLLVAFLWVARQPPTEAPAPEVGVEAPARGPADVDDARIVNAAAEPGNWLAYGRTYEEQRFSPLDQIDRSTVGNLGLAWYRDMQTTRALEATPIVVDGIMYVSSTWSRVYALDAATGREIWAYDPEVPRAWARRACCDVVNRGVAVYQGRVYVGTLDGRLVALDAATGRPVWEVDTLIDHERFYTITGAPRVARGKVFIGNGGAEFGVRGYLSAYDAGTGELAWRFFTVPGDPSLPFEHPELEQAARTWSGEDWWTYGGGGTVWNSIVYDPDLNRLYFGTGNGSPWTRAIRSPGGGDNLFLASIIAVDPDTGRMQWYYQTVPGENWDYTATQDIVLADLAVDGAPRKVLMQAPKNGFFYVIDRSNGQLLRAHKFVATTWASHVDLATGRPVENPEADYLTTPRWVTPTSFGARNWQGMSWDAARGVVYLTAHELPGAFAVDETWQKTGEYPFNPRGMNLGIEAGGSPRIAREMSPMPPVHAYFKAFDPLTGEDRWMVEHPHYWNGGALATAGSLVFQGNAAGEVVAYDADTGARLWAFPCYTSIIANPVTYAVDGVQYVAILAGTGGGVLFSGYVGETASSIYGNHGKLLVFKLGGEAALPVQQPRDLTIPPPPDVAASAGDIADGEYRFHEYCAVCHGFNARASEGMPDLRRLSGEAHATFTRIVLEGALQPNGMPGFADVLDEADTERIHAYVVDRARQDRAAAQESATH
jgi:quinohemoprotein ethanol dehydrogenase